MRRMDQRLLEHRTERNLFSGLNAGTRRLHELLWPIYAEIIGGTP